MLTHAFKPGDLHQGQVHFNGYARWDTSDDSTVEGKPQSHPSFAVYPYLELSSQQGKMCWKQDEDDHFAA
mgnify:CR=1 FL=1